ncbi:glycoside hydrolase family 43 protein [Polyporus arcularius HHB13444]|uniref:Glycoside hydrolase family 43 protein n=1 Tax=Polyporus arcularius HHB13444 TaxID=1314778 RepID=A0A5C3PVG1_9APHY|nr:glycoside hydrolase family 43 protein [Polyporus arcularius HHB13444]
MYKFPALLAIVAGLLPVALGASSKPSRWHTNGTYINNATTVAADPYVRWDAKTGAYWAYSTEGADPGWYYGIYTSPDLATWSKIPGGAIKNDSTNVWAQDWWWAPECYYNEKTGWYFLFHAGRYLNSSKIAEYFKYPDFEEASKIGVAVSRSPSGPFVSIADRPIDYHPFDPDYYDINLLMSPPYLEPPTRDVGLTAPKGTYIPSIDPNVFWDDDGSIWLFFSRNAYRNWVWSDEFGKYIEESNIYAVRLDDAWWNDPHAKTLPVVHKRFRDVHKNEPKGWQTSVNESFPGPTRKDGWVAVVSYALQPQAWENAHVNDHAASGGTLKDRRWSEGSTMIKRYDSYGNPVYFLTYSANNYQSPDYGVGYAYAHSVSGPYYKSGSNPVLSQDASRSIYSTGHGSIVASGANPNELYYPHHARPSPVDDRYLYTSRLFVEPDALYLGFGADAGDLRLPSGVAPLYIQAKGGRNGTYEMSVTSASGATFDLANLINRVTAEVVSGGDGVSVQVDGGLVTVDGAAKGPGRTKVKLVYERARSNSTAPWSPVSQFRAVDDADLVSTTITL